jgi:hypothetical protein
MDNVGIVVENAAQAMAAEIAHDRATLGTLRGASI